MTLKEINNLNYTWSTLTPADFQKKLSGNSNTLTRGTVTPILNEIIKNHSGNRFLQAITCCASVTLALPPYLFILWSLASALKKVTTWATITPRLLQALPQITWKAAGLTALSLAGSFKCGDYNRNYSMGNLARQLKQDMEPKSK